MTRILTRAGRLAALVAALGTAIAAAAAVAAAAGPPPTYQGPESQVATSYPTPTVKKGFKFTIGFDNPLAANEELSGRQKAIKATVKRLGGKVISLDAQLKVDKQVSDIDQLIAQKVDAIILYPLDPKALRPSLEKARKAGIPVFAMDATFGSPNAAAPGFVTQTWQGRDHEAYLQVTQMAKLKPGGNIVVIGIGAPVPSLKYWAQRVKYWAGRAGLTVLGQQDNPTDDAAGGQQAMSGLLNRLPQIDGVIAYNDPSALGAEAAARANGRKLIAIGENGGSDGLNGVRTGRLAVTLQHDVVGIGQQLVYAVYDYITGQQKNLPKVVLRAPKLVTKENLSQVKPWDEQIKTLKVP